MKLMNKRIGFAMTGSYCTFARVLKQVQALVEAGAQVQPILSAVSHDLDTRFMSATELVLQLECITGKQPWYTLQQVEPIGPKQLLDLMIIAPCTGNSLAKLAVGIADTPALLAAKSTLRNGGPVLLAVSTNDGLAGAGKNIGALFARKHIFFVPFGQDDPKGKPSSLVARMESILEAAEEALEHRQIQPVLLGAEKGVH